MAVATGGVPALATGALPEQASRRSRVAHERQQRYPLLPAIAESPARFAPIVDDEEMSDESRLDDTVAAIVTERSGGLRRPHAGKRPSAPTTLPPISERQAARVAATAGATAAAIAPASNSAAASEAAATAATAASATTAAPYARSESAASSSSLSSSRTAGSIKAGSSRSSRRGSRRGSRRSSSLRGSVLSLNNVKLKNLLNRLRPLQERTQGEPYRNFQRYARGVAAFVGLVKYNMERNSKWTQQYLNPEVLRAMEGDKEDLLFDISLFRSSKQSKIPKEAVRILLKEPSDRTSHEVHYIMVMQRGYPALAEYPLYMQQMIAERARYQTYPEKRLIVRQGQPAVAFYYILSGSAIVTVFDEHTGANKPVGSLDRGSMFGDEDIMRGDKRQSSVLSKEPVELLALLDSDYLDVFMSRGQKEANEQFMRSLGYMQSWPIEILADHPKKVIFTYFKRGYVMVPDSNDSEWIFIVKSGSVNVLKKLKDCPTLAVPRRKLPGVGQGEKVGLAMDAESHQQVLSEKEQELLNKAGSNPDKARSLSYYTPEINVTLNDVLQKIAKLSSAAAAVASGSKSPRMAAQAEAAGSSPPHPVVANAPDDSSAAASLQENDEAASSDANGDYSGTGNTTSESGRLARVDPMPSPATDGAQDRKRSQHNNKDVFVVTQVLSRGAAFGLIQAYASNIAHPSFSVVSNGAECIVLHKKLYLDNAPDALLHKLREEIFPYPSDEDLQEQLCVSLSWAKYRKVALHDELVRLKPNGVPPAVAAAMGHVEYRQQQQQHLPLLAPPPMQRRQETAGT